MSRKRTGYLRGFPERLREAMELSGMNSVELGRKVKRERSKETAKRFICTATETYPRMCLQSLGCAWCYTYQLTGFCLEPLAHCEVEGRGTYEQHPGDQATYYFIERICYDCAFLSIFKKTQINEDTRTDNTPH